VNKEEGDVTDLIKKIILTAEVTTQANRVVKNKCHVYRFIVNT